METVETGRIEKGIVKFILGGKASFTIHQDPDKNFKYLVKTSEDKRLGFVYIGGNYQGYITKSNGRYIFVVGKKGNPQYDPKLINGLLWVLNRGDNLPPQVSVFHHGTCSVCGRKLTDPESIKYGIGPTCRERINWG